MKKFLEQVVDDMLERQASDWQNLLIITPGKRSRTFFKHIVAQKISKPVLTPQILTINEFIEQESGLQMMEPIPAIAGLYKVYTKKAAHAETLDQFWFFGEMLLSDFNDVDKYMVNASHLFQYVKNLKSIEELFSLEDDEQLALIRQFWETLYKGTGHTDQQKIRHRFLQFWELLYPVYESFKKTLYSQGLGYEGMLYRMVAEKADANQISFDNCRPVMLGFNALSKAEHAIFKAAQRHNALFYWDYDHWYVNDPKQEAGYFMRQNLHDFPSALEDYQIFDNFKHIGQIDIYGLPGEVEMAQQVSDTLSDAFAESDDPLENGVILADENLLTPVLQTLPLKFSGLNVTMGLPVQQTLLYGFLQLLMEMPENRIVRNDKIYYKSEWVLRLLSQPFLPDETGNTVVEPLKQGNYLYIKADDICLNEWFGLIFPGEKIALTIYLANILQHLISDKIEKTEDEGQINTEAAVKIYRSLNQLQRQVTTYQLYIPEPLLKRLINRMISGLSLTLEGEPLHGTQIMGLIETRTLDFDHLVVAAVNEGFLPAASFAPSFIPYNLRKAYGLLTYENQDAIFAYYFYRAVQRCKHLTLIYNSNESDNQYGEKSRFLQQLQYEWPGKIKEHLQNHVIAPSTQGDISIAKDEQIQQKLSVYLEGSKSLFPLHLNTFINCPLRFYFQYLAEIKEPEKLEPGVDQRIFGLVFHDTMEELYKPFVEHNQLIEAENLKLLLKDGLITAKIRQVLEKYFHDLHLHRGNNGMVSLIEEVVLRYVKRVIQNDIQGGSFTLPGLENKYSFVYTFEPGKNIELAGKIDRLQRQNQTIYVIDYKTGRAPRNKFKFDNLFDYDEPNRSAEAFQTLLYTRIVEAQPMADGISLVPSLLYIQENQPVQPLTFSERKNAVYSALKEEFESGLNRVLSDLFNPDIPFRQTQNEDYCVHCPYREICHRF